MSAAWFRVKAPFLCGALTVAALTALTAGYFLPRQSLWGDEVTQLRGLELGPVEAARWLAGKAPYRFDAPPDRMPPLSYWLGWAWSCVFGLSGPALRAVSVTAVAAAAAVVFAAAWRSFGRAAGWFAGMACALSPNVTVIGVEIRAYALFLLAAAIGYYFLLRYVAEQRTRHVVGMTLASIAAMYLHFFGVLLAGSIWIAACLVAFRARASWRPLFVSAVMLGIAAIGLWPFVAAARQISGESAATPALVGELARLLYRQLAHVSMLLHPTLLLLGLAGAAVLACGAVWRVRQGDRPTFTLLASLVSGLIVVVAAQTMLSGFSSSSVNYNLWMLPGVLLLLSSACAAPSVKGRRIAYGAAAGMLLACVAGEWELLRQGENFAHGPFQRLTPLIDRHDSAQVVVLYEADADMSWQVFFPLRYRYGATLRQYLHAPTSEAPLRGVLLPTDRKVANVTAGAPKMLLVVRAQTTRSAELVESLQANHSGRSDGPLAAKLKQDAAWRLREERFLPGIFSADVEVFVPVGKAESGTSSVRKR